MVVIEMKAPDGVGSDIIDQIKKIAALHPGEAKLILHAGGYQLTFGMMWRVADTEVVRAKLSEFVEILPMDGAQR